MTSRRNARVRCDSLESINLKYWEESNSCVVDGVEVKAGTTQRVSPCRACACPRSGGAVSNYIKHGPTF